MSAPEVLFVKVNIKIFRDDGFLAAIGADRLHTLIALATYMDKDGFCYPSESLLGKNLGISATQVSQRIKDLATFRWKEGVVISVDKLKREKGRFQNNCYFISFDCGVSIFDNN